MNINQILTTPPFSLFSCFSYSIRLFFLFLFLFSPNYLIIPSFPKLHSMMYPLRFCITYFLPHVILYSTSASHNTQSKFLKIRPCLLACSISWHMTMLTERAKIIKPRDPIYHLILLKVIESCHRLEK